MGFADTDATPNKKRIVGNTGVLNDTLRSGIGIVVGIANNEVFKSIERVKIGGKFLSRRSVIEKRRGRRRGRINF